VAAILVSVGIAAPSPASATVTLSPAAQQLVNNDTWQGVVRTYSPVTVTGGDGPSITNYYNQLRTATNTAGELPAALNKDSTLLAVRTGLMSPVTKIPSVSLIVGTFSLGVVIGTGLNKKFFHVGGAGYSNRPPGDPIPVTFSNVQLRPCGTPVANACGSGSIGTSPMVQGGWVLTFNSTSQYGTQQIASVWQHPQPDTTCDASDTAQLWPPSITGRIEVTDGVVRGPWQLCGAQRNYKVSSWVVPPTSPTAPRATDLPVPYTNQAVDVDLGSSGISDPGVAPLTSSINDQLDNHATDYQMLIAWMNHVAEPNNPDYPDPTVVTVTVPNCTSSDTYATCSAAIAGAGLTSHKVTLSSAQADLTKPAGAVVSTNPAGGSHVATDTDVAVTVNPDTLPLVIPAPNANETYDAYVARLQALGLVGDVQLLTDATLDPTKAEKVVIRISPESGTRVSPGTTVKVYANPENGSAGGDGNPFGWTAPAVPALDLSPLSQSIPCGSFPFGVFCWIHDALGGWVGSSSCPQPQFPTGDDNIGDGHFTADMCIAEPALSILRPLILIVTAIGLAWLFAATAMGLGAATSEND